MRIVSGELKGRTLKGVKDLQIRPTSERVREAVFSAIGSRRNIENFRVLDLFAGSGALGIEALSRGAGACTFVEKDQAVLKVLKNNIEALEISSCCDLEHKDCAVFLKQRHAHYDLIFADPPYGAVLEQDLLELLRHSGIFKDGSLFIFEEANTSSKKDKDYEFLKVLFRKAYGDTLVSMYEFWAKN